jgi:archaeal flagellar protein FlaJ
MEKLFLTSWSRRHAALILAIVLTLGLAAGVLLAVFDYYFLQAFKSLGNVTAYFPWSYGINFTALNSVLALYYTGIGIAALLLVGVIYGLKYFFSSSFDRLVETWKLEGVKQKTRRITAPIPVRTEVAVSSQNQQLVTEQLQLPMQTGQETIQIRSPPQPSPYALPKEQHISVFERLLRFAIRITRAPTNFLSEKIPNMREEIQKSNLSATPEGIISVAIFATLAMVPAIGILMYLLSRSGYFLESLFLPLSLALPFVIAINIPKINANSRSAALDNELPYIVGYITILASGGVSPFTAIKRLASAANLFPAGAKEARRILLDIDLFGKDPISALEKAAHINPNRKFADFLGGYISVLKVGGNVQSYLEAQLREIFAYREIKSKSVSDTIGTLAESYIIATVVTGVSLFIIYLTENLIGKSAQSISPTFIILFSVVLVPAVSIAFIAVIDGAQLKEPFMDRAPYYAFFGFAPVGALFFFLPLGLPEYLQLGIALMIISTPGMIISIIHERRKRAVEARLANFLRDISEVRKTGLAPERTIQQLSTRNYGGLTPHVKMISNQLGWGIPIRRVLDNFRNSVHSWVTQAMAFLLLEVVEIGGGSPEMFETLAEFTEKNRILDKERRSQVRPYIIVPYIGAVLIVITTALMVNLLAGSGLSIATGGNNAPFVSPVTNAATGILLTASIFQAWVMGLVAGKMGELNVSDGLKHATLLVAISIITVFIAQFFVHL